MADAYTKCGHCDTRYLIELIDLKGNVSAYRIAALPSEYVDKTIHSLRKGSCDFNRARAEAASMASLATPLQAMLISHNGEFSELEVRYLRKLVPRGGHLVEAGANIGALTVPLAKTRCWG